MFILFQVMKMCFIILNIYYITSLLSLSILL